MTSTLHRTWQAASGCLFRATLLAICSAWTVSLAAQEQSTAESDATTVKPFVSETTFLIVKVDLARIDFPDSIAALHSLSPTTETAYRQLTQRVGVEVERLRSLVDGQPIFAALGIPVSETRKPAYIFVEKSSAAMVEKLLEYLGSELKSESCIHGDYFVTTPLHGQDVAMSLADCPASARESVADAFQAVAGYPAQVLLLPPPHVRRTIKELSPELPPQLGGGSSSVLTEGLQWAALGIDPAHVRAEPDMAVSAVPAVATGRSAVAGPEADMVFPATLSTGYPGIVKRWYLTASDASLVRNPLLENTRCTRGRQRWCRCGLPPLPGIGRYNAEGRADLPQFPIGLTYRLRDICQRTCLATLPE